MTVREESVVPLSPEDSMMWPVSMLFSPAEALAEGHGPHCTVELLNGSRWEAELLQLGPDAVSIAMAGAEQQPEMRRVDLQQVRMICLTVPLLSIGSAGVANGSGADDSTVSIRFRDGRLFSAITRGLVRDQSGLFLYLLGSDPGQALRCFIPAQQLEEVQIDPVQSESSTATTSASCKTIAEQPGEATELRRESLGQRLSERGVTSQEELKHMLLVQKRHPAAKLGDLLVEAGVISTEQLTAALWQQAQEPQRRVGDILVDMGAVTLRLVQIALSEKLGIPFINVADFHFDPEALALVSVSFAKRYQVLPVLRLGEELVVAMENPLIMDFSQELAFLTGHTVVPVIANPDDLRQQITRQYAKLELGRALADTGVRSTAVSGNLRDAEPTRTMGELRTELDKQTLLLPESRGAEVDPRVMDNALVRLINKIIIEAHAQGASDIHIESNAGTANTRIRFRKDGELEDYIELQPAYRNALVSRIKIMADLDISEHRHAQDGKIAFARFGPLQIELRVAVVPTSNNLEDVVLRILGGVDPLPLEKLGLVGSDLDEIRRMVDRSYGLILVCGPTGSGKTTTLHSLLRTINRPDIKIWTAEDPVEITQAGLRQVQINSRIGWTFAAAMRSFLRADPDVIMVGEMRDAETTEIGIEASLTGHLVFSTLHTNSAAESVVRLLELGMDPFNFADALIGILSQRLARKLCMACKKSSVATDPEIKALAQEYCAGTRLDPADVEERWRTTYGGQGGLRLYEAVGCRACNQGYKGRIGVYELLSGTPKIKSLIRSRGSVPQVVEAALEDGMHLLRQDAIEKVLTGVLDLASARAAST